MTDSKNDTSHWPSRRTVLKGLGASATLGIAAPYIEDAWAASEPGADLFQPAIETSRNGLLRVKVDARIGTYELGGKTVHLRGYDGGPVGRTLDIHAGDTLRLTLTNSMPFDPLDALCTAIPEPGDNAPRGFNVTNMHVHGVHVSPRAPADDILLLLRSGDQYNYVYDIPADHPPGTYFYHAHFHGSVALQVGSGMSGALIIRGEVDEIPEIKAAEEKVLVLQTQRFDEEGRCDNYDTLDTGEQVYVNGQINPVIRMRVGEVQRWRLINGSPTLETDLSLGKVGLSLGEFPFTVLGFDGNPLPATKEMTEFPLIPGNRADVLVKGFVPGTYSLVGVNGVGPIATLIVEGEGPDMALYAGPLPQVPALKPIAEADVTYGRRLEFGLIGGPPYQYFTINDKPFSCADAWPIPLGAVEEWDVYNHTQYDHPFHIHVNPFQMVSGGGVAPGTWLDTVQLKPYERIKFRTRFSDYTGTTVFHCHNLLHEDRGMMQAINIVET